MANEKEWQQDISNTVDTHTEKIDNHETRITQNENKLGNHEKRIDNIETTSDVGQIATRVQAIEDKNKEQDNAIDELKDKDTLLEQSINANTTLVQEEASNRAKAIDTVNTSIQNVKNSSYPIIGGVLDDTDDTYEIPYTRICRKNAIGELVLNAGSTFQEGASIYLNGNQAKSTEWEVGSANIRVIDPDNLQKISILSIAPKKQTLKFRGLNIVRSINNAKADDDGNVNIKPNVLEMVYPVGSIYMSVTNKSPATFLGGTWQALNEGRVLIGASSTYTAGKTGGEFTHKITVAELPAHNHSASTGSAGAHTHTASTNSTGAHTHNYVQSPVSNQIFGAGGFQNKAVESKTAATSSAGAHSHTVSVASNGAHTHSVSIGNTGSGNAMNNMQPYLAVYMWKRTA